MSEQAAPSLLSDFDLYLFGQGKDYRIYEKMGAHLRTVSDVAGVNFALWAPHALSVSVIGNFNDWQHGANPMHLRHQDLGEYYEVISSDAACYGGSGLENTQPMPSASISWQSYPHSLLLTLPPLSTIILKLTTTQKRT